VGWSLKVLGAIGLIAVQAPSAQAALVSAERGALEARVEAARRVLQQQAADEKPAGSTRFWVAQWLNWPNWGNWGNWGNWRNF
jgi:hypothetical protein